VKALRLLLVDPDPLILHGTGEALSREGFEVLVSSSGREAISLIEASPFEVIVTDLAVRGD
jgi:DNA-binding response OmpR family regulator